MARRKIWKSLIASFLCLSLAAPALFAGGAFGIEWGMKHLDLRNEGIKYEKSENFETAALYTVLPVRTHDFFDKYEVLLDYDEGVFQISAEMDFTDRERGAVTRYFFEEVKKSLTEKYGEPARSRKPWNQAEFMMAVAKTGYNARWYLSDGSSIVLETLKPENVKGEYEVKIRLDYYGPNWNRCSTRSYDARKDREILESRAGRV